MRSRSSSFSTPTPVDGLVFVPSENGVAMGLHLATLRQRVGVGAVAPDAVCAFLGISRELMPARVRALGGFPSGLMRQQVVWAWMVRRTAARSDEQGVIAGRAAWATALVRELNEHPSRVPTGADPQRPDWTLLTEVLEGVHPHALRLGVMAERNPDILAPTRMYRPTELDKSLMTVVASRVAAAVLLAGGWTPSPTDGILMEQMDSALDPVRARAPRSPAALDGAVWRSAVDRHRLNTAVANDPAAAEPSGRAPRRM